MTEIPPAEYALALPDSPAPYYLIGLGRQLAVLVLPIVAPLLAWLLLHQAYLRKIILGGLLQRRMRTLAPADSSPSPPADANQ